MSKTIGGRVNAKLAAPTLKAEGHQRKDIAPILAVDGRTIQHYSDIGLITAEIAHPTGRGTKRKYSKRNIFELLLIQVLLRHGFALARMKPVIQMASEEWLRIEKAALDGKQMILILSVHKSQSRTDKGSYKVELRTDMEFNLPIEMKDLECVMVVDVSDLISRLETG